MSIVLRISTLSASNIDLLGVSNCMIKCVFSLYFAENNWIKEAG